MKTWAALGAAMTTGALLVSSPALATHAPVTSKAPVSARLQTLRAEVRNGTLGQTHSLKNICAAKNLACNHFLVMAGLHTNKVLSTSLPAGYGATDLEKAYGLTKAPSVNGTITIIDAAPYPNLESDLAVYRSTYGLPACTTASGCLTIANRFGGKPLKPPGSTMAKEVAEEIAVETALDVDMASAACPNCKIIELQVPTNDGLLGPPKHIHKATTDFGDAVKTAVSMNTSSVSMSYGFPSDSVTDTGTPAKDLDQVGTALFASSGDSGFNGNHAPWPQTLTTVASVGGTSLHMTGNARGFTESAWSGAGSSCSADLGPAVGQPKSVSKNCNGARTSTDISAVADPSTGVAVYDTYAPFSGDPLNWIVVGGTSVSSPFVAGISARAAENKAVHGPNLLYADPKTAFNDVTTGANGTAAECAADGDSAKVCLAGKGWDGPTGLGTPIGLKPFTS